MANKLSIVYDLGYGSSGKGQVAAAVARDDYDRFHNHWCIRQGSIQAAHTVRCADGEMFFTRLVPCAAFALPGFRSILGAACLVNWDVLRREVDQLKKLWGEITVDVKNPFPIYVDEQASMITEAHEHREQDAQMMEKIGSCAEGVGAATSDRVMRIAPTTKDVGVPDDLKPYVKLVDTVELVGDLAAGQATNSYVQIESTQGVLLNLYTSGYYPYTTSRQVGPMALLSQTGTHPRAWDEYEAIGTCRTFPIRVGGNSGPMPNEITWEQLRKMTGVDVEPERATLTKRIRRITILDTEHTFRKAIRTTGPTSIAMTFLDYLFPWSEKAESWAQLLAAADEDTAHNFLDWLANTGSELGAPISHLSTGPGQECTFEKA